MKGHKKKGKFEIEDQPGDEPLETDSVVTALLEAITEDAHDQAKKGHDAFEIYQHQLHSHLHENPSEFRERFLKGYTVLLEDISHSS